VTTLPFLGFASTACILMAVLNAYQAVTGRRLNKAPSRRDDATMRRQSAVAAVLLGVAAALGLAVVTVDLCVVVQFGG
jgi:hypothetical protein